MIGIGVYFVEHCRNYGFGNRKELEPRKVFFTFEKARKYVLDRCGVEPLRGHRAWYSVCDPKICKSYFESFTIREPALIDFLKYGP